MPRPGTNHPVAAEASGAAFGNTRGDILIEDCDFSGLGDDALVIFANWLKVTQKIDARTVVLTGPYSHSGLIRSSAVLRFVKPDTLAEYARLNVTQASFDQSTGNLYGHG